MYKGVSPLIATVLLIAFTVAIGAIVSQFFLGSAREQAEEVEEQGEQTIDCGTAAIRIDKESIVWNSTTNELVFTVENTGQTDLQLPSMLWYNTSNIPTAVVPTRRSDNSSINATNPLGKGKLLPVHNTSVISQPSKIILTTNCPGKISSAQNNTSDNEWELVF